jgi:hypothetical protein
MRQLRKSLLKTNLKKMVTKPLLPVNSNRR